MNQERLDYLMYANPGFRSYVRKRAKRLADYCKSEEGQQAIEEFTTACYMMDLGEPQAEVFI